MFRVASSCISSPVSMLSRRMTFTSRQRCCTASWVSSEKTSTTNFSGGQESKLSCGDDIGGQGPGWDRGIPAPWECTLNSIEKKVTYPAKNQHLVTDRGIGNSLG